MLVGGDSSAIAWKGKHFTVVGNYARRALASERIAVNPAEAVIESDRLAIGPTEADLRLRQSPRVATEHVSARGRPAAWSQPRRDRACVIRSRARQRCHRLDRHTAIPKEQGASAPFFQSGGVLVCRGGANDLQPESAELLAEHHAN